MREKLVNYIDLLFAGIQDADDIKQEILQNTLDRYDDLISQGKMPEAAYQLAISGIGDISDIVGVKKEAANAIATSFQPSAPDKTEKPIWKKVLQAISIFLYILCPIPLFLLGNTVGLCILLALVGIATALMVISTSNQTPNEADSDKKEKSPTDKLIGTLTLAVYLVLSFASGAWHNTWLVFPIMGAVKGIVKACGDLKEE